MGLHLGRRGGVYQFRLRLPQDLATKLKRQDIRFSLRTRRPDLARRLANAGRVAMTKLFDHLRMLMETGPRHLSTDEIRQLAQEFFEREVAFDAFLRINAEEHTEFFQSRRENRPTEEQQLRDALGSGNARAAEDKAVEVLQRHDILKSDGTAVSIPTVQMNMLSFYLLRARLAANLLAQAHDRGDFSAAPADPLFKEAYDPLLPPAAQLMAEARTMLPVAAGVPFSMPTERQTMTIGDVKARMLREKSLSKKTRGDYDNAIKWLSEVVGDKPIGQVTDDDLLKYKDALLELPKNALQKLGTNNILEAIALNKERRQPLPTIALKTANAKYLGPIRELFEFASQNGHTVQKANPASTLRVKAETGRTRNKKRLPFTPKQLQRMFDTPVYLGCKSARFLFEKGPVQIRTHKYWVPLIALFSGCRLNEIGQMEVGDVQTFNGRPHFFVRTERDPEDDQDWLAGSTNEAEDDAETIEVASEDERTLKSDAAWRRVPVHPELIKLGLLNYLEERIVAISNEAKAGGKSRMIDQRLFPLWCKGPDGYYSSKFSRWFNGQFLPKFNLKTERHVFHSLRHNFKDAMRGGGVEQETQHRIIGHTSGHVSEEYGDGLIVPRQSNEIDRIIYNDLDLSHLHVPRPVGSIIEIEERLKRRQSDGVLR